MKTRPLILATFAFCLATTAGLCNAQPATSSAAKTAATPQRIATVDALMLVDLVLDSDAIKATRQAKGKELDETFRKSQKELMDLEARLLMGAKDDPLREGLIKDWEVKKQALNDLQAKLSSDFDKFNSHKAAEAWITVTAKLDELAAQYGYTHVLTTRRERSFMADTQAGTVQQLLSRQIIIAPAADDLTDRAIAAMNLQAQYDAKKADEAAQAAAAAAAAAEAAKAATPAPTAPADPKNPAAAAPPKTAPGFPLPADAPK